MSARLRCSAVRHQWSKGRSCSSADPRLAGQSHCPDADGLIVGATGTELPNNGTKTYTTADDGASPIDNVATRRRPRLPPVPVPPRVSGRWTCRATSPRPVPSPSLILYSPLPGFDFWKVKTVEQFTIAAAASAGAGKKAFAYIESIAIYSAGDITTDTVTVGWGDVLGLPLQADLEGRRGTGVLQRCPGRFGDRGQADATDPATATTGDVRGTVDTNSASDGSAVVVWMHVQDTSTPEGLRGVAQYGG